MFKNQILRNLLDRKSSTCWFLSRNENSKVLYRIFQNMCNVKNDFFLEKYLFAYKFEIYFSFERVCNLNFSFFPYILKYSV